MSQIIAIKVPQEMKEDYYKHLLSLVSIGKREKLSRFRHKRDAYRSLLGDCLVRHYLWDHFSISNDHICFILNQYGKPGIDLDVPFYFNISHSGDWVVCLFATQDVGVDIEKRDKVDLDVAKRFFSLIEYEDLMALQEPIRTKYFFDLWTLKESYIKCIGTGLQTPLHSFSVRIQESAISFTMKESLLRTNVTFKLYDFDSKYSLAACATSKLPESVDVITLEKLFSKVMENGIKNNMKS
ncbi:4'-phosphopantetheinyl transferase family protein [Metabacillus malikii]|uniref:4'-phosphopantetheinyl transferase n=1 Tax=Metabacillus malikii TaxID=1504265 RepID=A0ABT9ZKU2_9BACI|nr:4'-phosphopantetheinyl transferase superfamily protein [Metabacillus malikii]MDQ0232877.1 4'-phosphopantetheinyl transferase [Metabacillus malikii]